MVAGEARSLSEWVDRLGLAVLAQATGFAFILFVVSSLVVLLLEIRRSGNTGVVRSRAFVHDVIYATLYRGGLYTVVVWAIIANLLQNRLSFLQLGILRGLPMIVSVPIYWLLGDFLLYWIHRLQHRLPFLWAFHSVHHAEQQLSTFSQNHRHPVEYVLNGLVLYLPLAFVLGLSTRSWVPWYMAAQILEALQHAQLDWRFGPLYRWIVSPVFHSIHHSTDPRHFNRNFGPMFSFWDYLFGTAAPEREMPARYGLDGTIIRESMLSQFFVPFRLMFVRSGQPGAARSEEPAKTPAVASESIANADTTMTGRPRASGRLNP